jgi:fructokinase
MYKVGIDLGGTKVEIIVTDENHREVFRKRLPNGKENGYEFVLNRIKDLYTDACDEIKNAPHSLGLGTPGAISKETGLLKNSNIELMNGKPFKDDVEKVLKHRVWIENDANCFALAEAVIGAGKGKDFVFGVILGTGVGGGLIFKGQIIEGLKEAAGEWGHHTINYNDGAEWRTGTGAIEAYVSGTGAQIRYKEIFGDDLLMADIVYNYRKGESNAVRFMDYFLDHLAIAISNLIKFLDPDAIVLGGGLSNIDEIYELLPDYVAKYSLNGDCYTPILKNEYGDSAGVFGAAIVGII